MYLRRLFLLGFIISFLSVPAFSQKGEAIKLDVKAMQDSVATYLKPNAAIAVKVTIESVLKEKNSLNIVFSKAISDYYFRGNIVSDIRAIVKHFLPQKYKDYNINLYGNGSTLEELSSNFYNGYVAPVQKKKKGATTPVLVENISTPYKVSKGLAGRHLALWQSHGYYYDQPFQRWEWQRARIFETVEDLYTQSYVVPFLVPMLENAGANVLLPRERDFNIREVIVDNDTPLNGYYEIAGTYKWNNGDSLGFANRKKSYEHGENPFKMGTYRVIEGLVVNKKKKEQSKESTIKWIPSVREKGEYAVYVSYHTEENSTDAAYYIVKYSGGQTKFKVNQTMGGGTWIYLGKFLFDKGSSEQGVYLSNITDKEGKVVTADAVKFGGGMGNIARKPNPDIKLPFNIDAVVSGYPRFTEGSRYWLQWAGFADTVYSYSNNTNDYNDDYVSRGRWVNTLSGGSKVNPDYKGLNVPVDLSFAFHTDAGTFLNDSIVGTLAIYTRYSNNIDTYPTGKSRMLGREYTDIVQTQIVDDIRATYEPKWSRRGLWDRSYSESRSPNVPGMLLELLSHQNYADMKYGLDPSFRFTVSRAIYKGMLKFLAYTNNVDYVVQPLPVKNFSAEIVKGERAAVKLRWSGVKDPLEPTANPKWYVVYTKVNNGGFNNGLLVKDTTVTINIDPYNIYSYKVVAINDGGASFPSQVLSVGYAPENKESALVVNGFTLVSGPATFNREDSTFAGFNNMLDNGTPYLYDISFIGAQYDFDRATPWMDDDAPGFGASHSNYEDKSFVGNTFDYPYKHGKAFLRGGYNFVSASCESILNGDVELKNYNIVDIILGKQREIKVGRENYKYKAFPKELQKVILDYCNGGGNLLISGANIATDLWCGNSSTKEDREFALNVLKFKWLTDYASIDGFVHSVSSPFKFNSKVRYNTKLSNKVYAVEAADVLVPSVKEAFTILRYTDNNKSAAVAYKGNYKVISVGFPLETILNESEFNRLMAQIINFYKE